MTEWQKRILIGKRKRKATQQRKIVFELESDSRTHICDPDVANAANTTLCPSESRSYDDASRQTNSVTVKSRHGKQPTAQTVMSASKFKINTQNRPSQQDCVQEIQTLIRVPMRFRIRSHMPIDLSEGHVPLDTSKLHPEHAESLHICKRCAHNALLGQTSLSRQHRPPNKLLIAQISS